MTMLVMRQSRLDDFDDLMELAYQAGDLVWRVERLFLE